MSEHPALDVWSGHLDACPACLRAVRMRLAGALPATIARRCCGRGKPLYAAMVSEAEDVARVECRRSFLIKKKTTLQVGLSASEAEELNRLQEDFEARLDALRPMPTQALDELERIAADLEARELPGEGGRDA